MISESVFLCQDDPRVRSRVSGGGRGLQPPRHNEKGNDGYAKKNSRIAAKHGNEGVHNEPDYEGHLAQGEPKFGFAVPFHRKDIDESNLELLAIRSCYIQRNLYPYRTMTMAMMPPAGTASLQ